jgi:hypothetical protein
MRRRNIALTTIAAACLLAAPSWADVIYDFEGDCTDGCGAAVTTAVLTLTDAYSPGDPLVNTALVVSLEVHNGVQSSAIVSPFLLFASITGLPSVPGTPTPASMLLADIAFLDVFQTDATGGYSFSAIGFIATSPIFASGENGVWTLRGVDGEAPIPEPAAALVFAAGFAVIGLRRRRGRA